MLSDDEFDAAMARMLRRRADELAAWELGDAFDAPIQALFAPAFHATLRIALIEGELDVAAAEGDTLVDLEMIPLPAAEIAALVADLDARLAAPRAREPGTVRDGMAGAIRTPRATLSGHYALLEPADPLTQITHAILRLTLAHARARPTIRALETVASYLDGFEPIRLSGGPPWVLRVVRGVSSSHKASVEAAMAAIGPEDDALVDLSECTFIAGMFWGPLLRWAARRPRLRWRVHARERALLREHGVSPLAIAAADDA